MGGIFGSLIDGTGCRLARSRVNSRGGGDSARIGATVSRCAKPIGGGRSGHLDHALFRTTVESGSCPSAGTERGGNRNATLARRAQIACITQREPTALNPLVSTQVTRLRV